VGKLAGKEIVYGEDGDAGVLLQAQEVAVA
jgi:hypothetical protein